MTSSLTAYSSPKDVERRAASGVAVHPDEWFLTGYWEVGFDTLEPGSTRPVS
jgi:hypothetical protein